MTEYPHFPYLVKNPGPEYADDQRMFQGIPGLAVSPGGRLWATWYTDGEGEEADLMPRWTALKPGKFMMGADPGPDVLKPNPPKGYEVERDGATRTVRADVYQGPHWDERPVHGVMISSAFEIIERVTLGEFLRYQPEHAEVYAAYGLDIHPEAPVMMITWDEAQGYCQWLSEAEGSMHRLPTEAEWEYAAGQTSALGLEGLGDGLMEWCYDWWAPYAEEMEVV